MHLHEEVPSRANHRIGGDGDNHDARKLPAFKKRKLGDRGGGPEIQPSTIPSTADTETRV